MPKKSNKKRADGRYAVQVYLGMVDGKRKYKTVYGSTQKEADNKADELRIKLNKGIDLTKSKDSFEQWASFWLSAKSIEISDSHKMQYERCIKRYNNAFGNRKISDIKTYDIQMVINEMAVFNENTNKPSSKKLLMMMKQTAQQIFRYAINNRIIDYSPADAIIIPKNAPQETRRALTKEEREWVANTPHKTQIAAMIMMYAGLRKGELIPLTWADINLNEGTIDVTKAVEYIGDKPQLKSTKTKSGIRTVFIPDILIEYLKQIPKNTILVFPNTVGNMHSKTSFKRWWDSYMLEIDIKYGKYPQRTSKFDPRFHGISIENITPHMLRHTFCTMMYENGVDVVTAKNQMGHSDIKTTLEIYTHLSSDHAKEQMQKMNKNNNASQMQVSNNE